MDITITYMAGSATTDDVNKADRVVVTNDTQHVATLVKATHPMSKVQGFTLNPHPSDPAAKVPHYYSTDAFAEGCLDQRTQNRLYVHSGIDQTGARRSTDSFPTVDQFVATIKPLLS